MHFGLAVCGIGIIVTCVAAGAFLPAKGLESLRGNVPASFFGAVAFVLIIVFVGKLQTATAEPEVVQMPVPAQTSAPPHVVAQAAATTSSKACEAPKNTESKPVYAVPAAGEFKSQLTVGKLYRITAAEANGKDGDVQVLRDSDNEASCMRFTDLSGVKGDFTMLADGRLMKVTPVVNTAPVATGPVATSETQSAAAAPAARVAAKPKAASEPSAVKPADVRQAYCQRHPDDSSVCTKSH